MKKTILRRLGIFCLSLAVTVNTPVMAAMPQAETAQMDVYQEDRAGAAYIKDYEDGIAGEWEGAAAEIIEDADNPGNHVLQLNSFLPGTSGKNIARDASAPAIADGTVSMKVKAVSSGDTYYRMGFVYRAENADTAEANQLTESGGWFICNEGSFYTGYPKYTELEERGGIKTNVWNDIKIQYAGEEVEISVNGIRYGKASVAGQSVNAGTFGFRNANNAVFLVDDVEFTTEMLDMGEEYEEPPIELGRKVFSEDYAQTEPNWSAEASALEGILTVQAEPMRAAVNLNSDAIENGMYTYQIRTGATGMFGAAFNIQEDESCNAVYSVNPGEYRLKAGEEDLALDGGELELKPDTSYQIKISCVGNTVKLYVDGVLVTEKAADGLIKSAGKSGLYNPLTEKADMKITAHESYELFYYYNDFSDEENLGGWIGKGGAVTASRTEDEKLNLHLNSVTNAIAEDAPMIQDGIYEFDFTNTPEKEMDPQNKPDAGRVGFLFRADGDNYESVFFDIGQNWFWLNNSAYGKYNAQVPLENGVTYHVRLEVAGNEAKLYLDGELAGYGAYTLPERYGRFGIRKQWANSNVLLDNLEISETVKVPVIEKDDKPVTIQSSELAVTMDENFPRVLNYQAEGGLMPGNQKKTYSMSINGEPFVPIVKCEKTAEDTLEYQLSTSLANMKIQYQADGMKLNMKFLSIEEKGDALVKDIQFTDHVLISTEAGAEGTSMASVHNSGGWYDIYDIIYEDMKDAGKADCKKEPREYGMLSSGGLAATIRNSAAEAPSMLMAEVYETENGCVGTLGDGLLTVRTPLDIQEGTLTLPWSTVLVCGDYNKDGQVNWHDAAANHKNIRREVKGMDTMKDNMMYIAMNFASQVHEPFLKSLDTGKIVYNLTDGFGQMIMEKGYAAEGHDDSHGDYGGHIGVRQGGKEDFNKVIELGKQYNMKYGIHINVSEHIPDGLFFNKDTMFNPLSANWGWTDQAYWVDEDKDILTGNRTKNLDALKADLPDLNFVYVDIYANSGWKADNLVSELNKRGYIAGTEFGGAMEQGAAFTHWGHDNSYPNHGNNSTILKYFKHDLDVFVTDAMFKGGIMPRIGSWGSKNDINEAQEDFFNHNLPTKYMQHFDVLNIEEDSVTFSDGVTVSKKGSGDAGDTENIVTLKKDGNTIATWNWWKLSQEDATWADENTGEATLFIPWYGEDSKEKNPDEAAKVYHWNPKGGTTTWDVPKAWEKVTQAKVYKLTADDKELAETVTIENGKVTLAAQAKTGYVLYPSDAPAPKIAGNFGEGSNLKNPGFSTFDLSDWNCEEDGATAKVEQAQNLETGLLMEGNQGGTVSISQEMTGLKPGTANTVYFFAEVGEGSELEARVKVKDQIYTKSAYPTDVIYYGQSKFWGKYYQKVRVNFTMPENTETAELVITGKMQHDGAKIRLDDITTFENFYAGPVAGQGDYQNYVLYEDFENTEQGYGALQLAFNSGIATHLAEYREEANQYRDYVISGNFSLKSNETGRIGEILRSAQEVKLQPNTSYKLEFSYETGIDDAYRVSICRPDRDAVWSQTLEATQLYGEGKKISADFTTGPHDDYYLSIETLKNIATAEPAGERPEGSSMEYIYLSLDDMKIYAGPADKTKLQSLVDEIRKMDLTGYTPDSADRLKEALKQAEEVLANEDLYADQQSAVDEAEANLKECRDALVKKEPETILVTNVRLDKNALLMTVGERAALKASVLPANATDQSVQWKTDNPGVAEVDNRGNITAKRSGTARITVSSGPQTAVCTVSVGIRITYVLKSGTNHKSNKDFYLNENLTLKNPVRKGYVFAGWHTDSKCKAGSRIKTIQTLGVGNMTLYAKWEKVKVGKTRLKSAKNSSAKSVKVLFTKVKGAKGYEILCARDKKFKKGKVKTYTKKLSCKVKKLSGKKTYYVKVRAYKTDSAGNKVYGVYSKAQRVKMIK